jgi:hypothetical protein
MFDRQCHWYLLRMRVCRPPPARHTHPPPPHFLVLPRQQLSAIT